MVPSILFDEFLSEWYAGAMSVDTEMMSYKTNFASDDPVDFLASEGPLRAEEHYVEASYESQQILTVPPQEAVIWQEWRTQVSQDLADTAFKAVG